jgi:hypothetical protein
MQRTMQCYAVQCGTVVDQNRSIGEKIGRGGGKQGRSIEAVRAFERTILFYPIDYLILINTCVVITVPRVLRKKLCDQVKGSRNWK